jgi:hypothetical protein
MGMEITLEYGWEREWEWERTNGNEGNGNEKLIPTHVDST